MKVIFSLSMSIEFHFICYSSNNCTSGDVRLVNGSSDSDSGGVLPGSVDYCGMDGIIAMLVCCVQLGYYDKC